MKRVITSLAICLLFVAAVLGETARAAGQIHVVARYPIKLIFTNTSLSGEHAILLNRCKLQFHLKAGMTNQEANNEVDAAYQRWFDCLRNPPKQTLR
jgi:hypothetical protein